MRNSYHFVVLFVDEVKWKLSRPSLTVIDWQTNTVQRVHDVLLWLSQCNGLLFITTFRFGFIPIFLEVCSFGDRRLQRFVQKWSIYHSVADFRIDVNILTKFYNALQGHSIVVSVSIKLVTCQNIKSHNLFALVIEFCLLTSGCVC